MTYVSIIFCVCAAIAAGVTIAIKNKQEKELLQRLGRMIEAAREGNFRQNQIDESLVSSVENDMSRFLEENYAAGAKVQKQKELIQTLISDISHQTVTPISNIVLYSQLIEEQLCDSKMSKRVEAISEQAEKLSFLIESLVKASRLEAGIIQTSKAVGDPFEMLPVIVTQVAQKARNKQIKIEIKEPEETIYAIFDEKWTTEALYNILDNAVKYTQNNGNILLQIKAYTMFVRIDITDNGVGMEEEEIPKIFGRFYRREQTNQEEGVGLGLYLAREIIRQQGGYIKVKTTLGKGSTFSVFLPALQQTN